MQYILTLVDVSRYTWRRMGKSYTVRIESFVDPAQTAQDYEARCNSDGSSVLRRVIDVVEVR